MYCQSCGAENTEGARFCNMCGTSLAKAGETGGLLAGSDVAAQMAEPTVPDSPPQATGGQHNTPGRTIVGGVGGGESGGAINSGAVNSGAANSGAASRTGYDADLGASGTSMMGVSLAGIGVKSSKKTWSMIVLGALALLGAGALASWLAMGGSGATDGHAEPDDPFVIGSPLPSDGDVDSITGMAGVATSASEMQETTGSSSMSGSTMSASMNSASSAASMTASMTTSTTASMTTSTTASMTASMTTQTQQPASMTTTNSGGSTAQMTAEMTSPTEMTGTTTTMGTNSGDIEVPEERDIEMELYSARVRFLIQRYYASRAQACFDLATRNNPSVSGTVVIAMTIGAEGNISNTSVARNTTGNSVLGTCLSSQVSSWRLSAPPGGSLSMQIPFSR